MLTWGSLLTEGGGNNVNRVSAKRGRATEKNGRRLPPSYKVVPGRPAGDQFVQICINKTKGGGLYLMPTTNNGFKKTF